MSTQEELTRRELWARTRLVVLDTETTGLHSTARIVSVAVYVVENGVTIDSWSTLVNPGVPIGATHIHKLRADHLAGAKPFAASVKKMRALLTATSKDTYVVGHNVTFDVARLAFEFREAGEKLPDLLLLDTKVLAPLAGVGSWSSSLEDFANAYELTNPAPHEANGDALITREVALRSINALISTGVSDLSPYATKPWQRVSHDDEPAIDLSPEHLALHAQDLTDKVAREKALAQCLVWSCHSLHRRIEDGVTDAASARSLLDWSVAQLSRSDLSRYQLGLLAAGALRVIEGRRQLLVNPKPDLLTTSSLRVLDAFASWEVCGDKDQCDKCASGQPDRCRFARLPRKLVWVVLYNKNDQVPLSVAVKYLFGAQAKPLGKLSTYDQFRERHPDAALRGAVVAARTMRSLGQKQRALVGVKALWEMGLRGPGLTEIYAALEEDNIEGDPLSEAIERAKTVCDVGLESKSDGEAWDRIRSRRARLERRLNRVTKPAPANPRNTRPAHKTRFVRPQ